MIEPIKSAAEYSHMPATRWLLRLYVAGKTPMCIAALEDLQKFCLEHLAGHYEIELVDLIENPRLAREDQIIAIPTLVRKLPEPLRRIIGSMSDTERMLVGLELKAKT